MWRGSVTIFANVLPELSFLVTAAIILWQFIYEQNVPGLFQMSLIALVPLTVMVVFHLLIVTLLPVRWPAIRGDFSRALGKRFEAELDQAYLPVPGEVAAALEAECKELDALLADGRQVSEWLAARQGAVRIGELYGV